MHLFHGRHLWEIYMYDRCKRMLCASVVQYVQSHVDYAGMSENQTVRGVFGQQLPT